MGGKEKKMRTSTSVESQGKLRASVIGGAGDSRGVPGVGLIRNLGYSSHYSVLEAGYIL